MRLVTLPRVLALLGACAVIAQPAGASLAPPTALEGGLPVARAGDMGVNEAVLARLSLALDVGAFGDVRGLAIVRRGRLIYEWTPQADPEWSTADAGAQVQAPAFQRVDAGGVLAPILAALEANVAQETGAAALSLHAQDSAARCAAFEAQEAARAREGQMPNPAQIEADDRASGAVPDPTADETGEQAEHARPRRVSFLRSRLRGREEEQEASATPAPETSQAAAPVDEDVVERSAPPAPDLEAQRAREAACPHSIDVRIAALEAVSGTSIDQLADAQLFDALGAQPVWQRQTDPADTAAEPRMRLALTHRTLARVAEVHRAGGVWGSGRVLPGDWVRDQLSGPEDAWRRLVVESPDGPVDVRMAGGQAGSVMFLAPSRELSVAITRQPGAPSADILGVMSEYVLPAAFVAP